MHIEAPWKHSRCIICLKETLCNIEHVIPKSLGGNLTCRFVCVSCNSRMGHLFEGGVKADPTIRLLASKLTARLHVLAEKLSKGQTYISIGPGGKFLGYMKSGEFVTQSQKLEDGSLIQNTPEAMKSIHRMLQRAGSDEVSITESLRYLEATPENTRVSLAHGLEIIKWSVERIEPALDGPLLSPLVPLKSAYEFLAFHLDSAVYEEVPALTAARTALCDGTIDQAHLLIERLYAPKEKPIHGIVFEDSSPYVKIQVRFFGQLAFRVHFRTLSIGGPRFVYTHDLESNTEHVSHSSVGKMMVNSNVE